jgi:hypothetical protein
MTPAPSRSSVRGRRRPAWGAALESTWAPSTAISHASALRPHRERLHRVGSVLGKAAGLSGDTAGVVGSAWWPGRWPGTGGHGSREGRHDPGSRVEPVGPPAWHPERRTAVGRLDGVAPAHVEDGNPGVHPPAGRWARSEGRCEREPGRSRRGQCPRGSPRAAAMPPGQEAETERHCVSDHRGQGGAGRWMTAPGTVAATRTMP